MTCCYGSGGGGVISALVLSYGLACFLLTILTNFPRVKRGRDPTTSSFYALADITYDAMSWSMGGYLLYLMKCFV